MRGILEKVGARIIIHEWTRSGLKEEKAKKGTATVLTRQCDRAGKSTLSPFSHPVRGTMSTPSLRARRPAVRSMPGR